MVARDTPYSAPAVREADMRLINIPRRYSSRPVVMVSGPYRSKSRLGVLLNIWRAWRVARELWRMGCAVVCPHTSSAGLGGTVPDADFLEGDLCIEARCDSLVLIRGWERSEGALGEREAALDLGITVFYWPQDREKLSHWLERWRVRHAEAAEAGPR
jgi:hypothetical protein